jgi:ribosomal protein S18 acetylase RimI-like enzyme
MSNRLEGVDASVHRSTSAGVEVQLAPLRTGQANELQWLFTDAVARGEGYPQTPPLTREAFEEVWIRPVTLVVAATVAPGRLVGAYYLKPNQPGIGAHIANAGYLVGRDQRGGGIGTLLVEDSIARAPLAGFDAIQFNFVFVDNPARSLYERLGWRVVGQIPGGAGPGRDALIYWRAVG